MKAKQISAAKGYWRIITETDRKFLWFKLKPIVRTFEAYREFTEGYWDWSESPNESRVNDSLSFQLDYWMRNFIIKNNK